MKKIIIFLLISLLSVAAFAGNHSQPIHKKKPVTGVTPTPPVLRPPPQPTPLPKTNKKH